MLSPVRMSLLSRAAANSVSCERRANVPAELTIAQWALESGWGIHQPGNNCFGIKAYPGCWGVQTLTTFEVIAGIRKSVVAEFATFLTLEACFEKHAALLTSATPYLGAWFEYRRAPKLETLIRQIAPVYATDPQYAENLLHIVAMPEVAQCLAAARKAD